MTKPLQNLKYTSCLSVLFDLDCIHNVVFPAKTEKRRIELNYDER